MIENNNTHCADCGAEFKPEGCGTGYAIIRDTGVKICYACADKRLLAEMQEKGKMALYLVQQEVNGEKFDFVTSWSGGLSFPAIVFEGGHNWWHVKQFYAYFWVEGEPWYGRCVTGGFTDVIRCKRVKKLTYGHYKARYIPDLLKMAREAEQTQTKEDSYD